MRRLSEAKKRVTTLFRGKHIAKNGRRKPGYTATLRLFASPTLYKPLVGAVFNYVRHGLCTAKDGTKRYTPKIGNDSFHRHMECHAKSESLKEKQIFVVLKEEKKLIQEAEAKSYALEMLPLGFFDKKNGILSFASSIVALGQKYPPSVQIDIEKLLPCRDTVRSEVIQLSEKVQKTFNLELPAILELGGGITCDGVKLEANGKKHYDMFVNYIKFSRRSVVSGGGYNWKLCNRLLFIAPHKGTENAEFLRETIETN